jgi:hypothetical protein
VRRSPVVWQVKKGPITQSQCPDCDSQPKSSTCGCAEKSPSLFTRNERIWDNLPSPNSTRQQPLLWLCRCCLCQYRRLQVNLRACLPGSGWCNNLVLEKTNCDHLIFYRSQICCTIQSQQRGLLVEELV